MAKDLTVTLKENKPGAFSQVAEALGRAGVNIEGVAEIEGIVHVLVEDAVAARRALEAAGLNVEDEREVLVVNVPDRPGELAKITRKIADEGVNLDVLYMASETRIVIGVKANEVVKARQALAAATRSF